MNFIKRLKIFLLGTGIGTLIIIGFFGNRIFSCSYFPNSRVLNKISKKEIVIHKKCYNSLPKEFKFCAELNFIKQKVLTLGEIYFSRSLPRKKPFPIYQIYYTDKVNGKTYIFEIENQTKKAIVEKIRVI